MDSKSTRTIGICILVGGLFISLLLFRIDRRPTAAPSFRDDQGVALRGRLDGVGPSAPLPMSVDHSQSRVTSNRRPVTTVLTPLNQPSPVLAPLYPGDDPLVSAGWNLPPELGMPRESTGQSSAARWHRVADGDTLEQIARRYLGNPKRADDIYVANRDRLEDPKLLPIGTRLRIPPN